MAVPTIVPGHGPIGGKAELADMRDSLVLLTKEARARYDAKMAPDGAEPKVGCGPMIRV